MHGTWALTLRSLRQDSRLLRFHLLRLVVAVGVGVALVAACESMGFQEAPGRELLEALGWTNFWAVTIAGVLLFAPTITEEKEDQTLGLLRMTGIGPSSLLLGKALPKLGQLLLVLIVQLPLVWLTRTLGGVDWLLMMNVYLLVFGQLIGVVAISMLASVVMRTSAGAVVAAGVLVCLWSLGPVTLADELQFAANRGSVVWDMLHAVASFAAQMSLPVRMDALLRSGATVPGTPLALGANLTWVGLLCVLSVWSFNYWNPHESTQTELEWVQEKWQRVWFWMTHFRQARKGAEPIIPIISQPASPSEPSLPTPMVESHPVEAPPSCRSRYSHRSWNNAIAWKDYFLLGGGVTGLRIRITVAGLGMIGIVMLASDLAYAVLVGIAVSDLNPRWFEEAMQAIMVCAIDAFFLDLLYLTVNLFAYELRRQTWESLQLLPLSLGTICRRKILGAACHLIPWVVAFLCGLALSITSADLDYFWKYPMSQPLAVLGNVLQVVSQFVTALIVLTWLSLRFNPWVSILLTGAFYGVIGVAWIISLFMVFGFLSPPGPYYQQVLFNVGWIGGISLLGWGLLRSIRSTLNGEAASV